MHIWQIESATASQALSRAQTPAYLLIYLQTKRNEQIRPLMFSDKEKENCIYQNDQNLLYWNRYFVMYPCKCTFKNMRKKHQEKWENAYLTVKHARTSRALRQALDLGQYLLALFAWLRFTTSAKSQKQFLGPPLTKFWIRYCVAWASVPVRGEGRGRGLVLVCQNEQSPSCLALPA